MAKIVTVSVKNEDLTILDKLKELKWKERKSESEIIILAVKEYLERHGDGNPNFKITQFQDPNFKVCPAFFRNKKTWLEYFKSLDKKGMQEYLAQAQVINEALKESGRQ